MYLAFCVHTSLDTRDGKQSPVGIWVELGAGVVTICGLCSVAKKKRKPLAILFVKKGAKAYNFKSSNVNLTVD